MPIDPTGTKPEPLAQEEVLKEINLKCKRCPSTTAEELRIPGNGTASGRHMYRCIKCSLTWAVAIGGSFDF